MTQEYLEKKRSMQEIADELGVKSHTVQYWMKKHKIQRRGQSEATYVKRNPKGDPFKIKAKLTEKEKTLFYLAIGLYLGEGKKKGDGCKLVLGNTDPLIIRIFLKFLREICGVEERKIKLELNIYDDVDLKVALEYWSLVAKLPLTHFFKPIVRKARKGNYKCWSRYGTLSVSVSNKKLCQTVLGWCGRCTATFADVATQIKAEVAQSAEHLHGKQEATGSIPVLGSGGIIRHVPCVVRHSKDACRMSHDA